MSNQLFKKKKKKNRVPSGHYTLANLLLAGVSDTQTTIRSGSQMSVLKKNIVQYIIIEKIILSNKCKI